MGIKGDKNKLPRRILILFVIVIIIGTTYMVLIPYKQFEFYRSNKFTEVSMPFLQSINMYFDHYLKYPTTGDELIEFLDEQKLINEVFGSKIPSEIISHGIGIKRINGDSLICVYSFGQNKKDDSDNALNFPEKISFTDFLFNRGDILIGCATPRNLCEISNVKLYFQGTLVNNNLIEKNIRQSVKRFRIRNTSEINNTNELVNPKEYYFYGTVNKENLEIKAVCNPDNRDLKIICDSLELLLWNNVDLNRIDEIYFPMTIYDVIYNNTR